MGETAFARAAAGGEELEQVFLRCRRRDPSAFAEAYRRVGGALYGTALRMLGRPDEAEDAVQDTFLSFYHHAERVLETQGRAWLRRVLVNRCLDRIRARKRRPEDALDEAVAAPALLRSAGSGSTAPERLDLGRAVRRLPERARLVFVLHDAEGLGHREIAELMGISEGTSKSQLFRARELLRGWLGEERSRR
jgi:RNA polymerase sigma-70 factor (ECF subfamily)